MRPAVKCGPQHFESSHNIYGRTPTVHLLCAAHSRSLNFRSFSAFTITATMSSPAPAPVPTATAAAALPGAPSALSGVLGRMKEATSAVMKLQKPWSEVFDRSVISKPASFGEVGPLSLPPSFSHMRPQCASYLSLISPASRVATSPPLCMRASHARVHFQAKHPLMRTRMISDRHRISYLLAMQGAAA